MNQTYVDLHVHSTESDGTFTPKELVAAAKEAGLGAFALTDHDTTAGIAAASEAAKKAGITLVPGVELSTEYSIPSTEKETREIHVVGLFIDPEHPKLAAKTKEFRDCRDNRNVVMVEALQKAGFSITMEELYAENPDCVITRANIARFLFSHGQLSSVQEAFDKYIGEGCPCYVGRFKITPMEAAALIHEAGGIVILAHPMLYHMTPGQLQQLIDDMKTVGLDGIEALYSTYTPEEEALVKELAAKNHLLISGGSDFHGTTKPAIRLGVGKGNLRIPASVLDVLRERAESRAAEAMA